MTSYPTHVYDVDIICNKCGRESLVKNIRIKTGVERKISCLDCGAGEEIILASRRRIGKSDTWGRLPETDPDRDVTIGITRVG